MTACARGTASVSGGARSGVRYLLVFGRQTSPFATSHAHKTVTHSGTCFPDVLHATDSDVFSAARARSV